MFQKKTFTVDESKTLETIKLFTHPGAISILFVKYRHTQDSILSFQHVTPKIFDEIASSENPGRTLMLLVTSDEKRYPCSKLQPWEL